MSSLKKSVTRQNKVSSKEDILVMEDVSLLPPNYESSSKIILAKLQAQPELVDELKGFVYAGNSKANVFAWFQKILEDLQL